MCKTQARKFGPESFAENNTSFARANQAIVHGQANDRARR